MIIMKKKFQKLILLLCISFLASSLNAQVTVTSTGGTPTASYATLNAAFAAINTGTHQDLIDINITANTTEPAVASPLVSSGTGAALYSLVIIRPTGDVTVNSAAAPTASRGVIEFLGADNVIIEGDDAGTAGVRNLTFQAAAVTTTGVALIRFSSASVTDGATGNTIRNCNIIGSRSAITSTVTNYGIYSGTTGTGNTSTSGQSDNNDNLTIENNNITRCYWGVYCAGTATNYMDNLIIRNNVIGSTIATDVVANRGIYVQNTQAVATPTASVAIIEGNDIRLTTATGSTTDITGVEIANGNCGIEVRKNHIHDINQPNTSGYGAYGIWITGSGNNSSVHIYNNFIRDIYNAAWGSTTDASDFNAGIMANVGTQGIRINHNSISLQTPNGGAGVFHSACIYVGSGTATIAELQNNIFVNTQGAGVGSFARAIFTSATLNISGGIVNGNNYYTPGTSGYVGRYNAADQITLTAWQTATTKDANSYSTNPTFTSTTDLHIPAATSSLLESGGVTIASIPSDYDNDARPGPAGSVNGGGTMPDVGADEFDGTPISNCSGSPAASNAVALPTAVCTGVNFALSLDVTYTELGYTYQWESSADDITYLPIGGATNATLNTNQTVATYYHCIITCTNSGLSTTSASVQVTMNPFTACYCTPAFPGNVEPITLVNFAGINNTTSATLNGTPALEDFTSMTANVTQGNSYPITLKGNTDGGFTNYFSVFIDFNQNGSLSDPGESFNIGTIANSTGVDAVELIGNITIPFASTPGVTRMRVIKLFGGFAASCNAAGYGQAEDYSIDITAAVNCTGTPTPGTISTASLNVCPSTNVTLNLTGQTSDANITIQWESSTDGVLYNPIIGANGVSYSTTISAVTYFQCVVTCTSSGLSATTTPVQFNINPFTSCYCAVTFPSNVEPITLVNFAGINNTTSALLNGTPAQEDFTSITATVIKGQSFPITLKGNTDGNYTSYLTVYIDFNQNGSYADLGENFEIGTITNSTGVDAIELLGNISIPITATTGMTGMRVIKKFNSIALPCNAAGFGQAEDYTIDIQPCVPPASITLVSGDADAIICPNTSVVFTAPTGLAYYDFLLNGTSVQAGTSNTYTNFALAVNDVVEVIAGYDATCATTSNSFLFNHHAVPIVNAVGNDASCFGVADGSVDITVIGGTPSYSYVWSNGTFLEDLAAVVGGTYSVAVIDANGCSGNATITISQPADFNVTVNTTDISCFGLTDGAINLTVSGANPPYTYDWDIDGTGDFDDTEDLSSLAAGIYNGVIMDASGCTNGGSITIVEPGLLEAIATIDNISCFGLTDGSIDILISGGTAPFTYDWDTDGTGDFDDIEDLNSLSAGTYILAVVDANGCTTTTTETIVEPSAISTNVDPTDITCNGLTNGELDLTVTGGTSPFTYDWDNDGTGDFDDTEDLAALSDGTYNVIIMDANGCGSVSGGTIIEPSAFNINVVSDDASCFGLSDGSIDLTASGATPPYTYDWDTDGTGDFDDTEDLSGLAAGVYNGVIMDANGCTEGGAVTIGEPAEIVTSFTINDISCNGLTDGEIDLTVTGATGLLSYDWDIDGTSDFDDTEDLTGLSAGTYNVVVLDNNTNCSVTNSATIVEPGTITVNVVETDITCNGLTDGEIDITVVGGTAPFTYDWDNDGTGDFDDTEDLTGLAAGTFTVVVNDDNGCPSGSASGTIAEPTVLALSSVVTNSNCNNGSDGEIDLTITGGTGAYVISWSNLEITEDITGLAPASYSVTVTDDNGCTETANETVGFDHTAPTVTLTITPSIACNTESAMTLGGESPTGGNWSGTGVLGSTFNPSTAGIGTHTIVYTFTDGNGCSGSAQDDIQVDDCTGFTEITEEIFSVYPNPTTGLFAISTKAENGNIIIRDAIGKVVYTSTFTSSKINMDLTSFARGIYYISLETSEGTMIQKLVKN